MKRSLVLILALALLLSALASCLSVLASAESPTVVTDVPMQEVILAEQDYDDIQNGDYLTNVQKIVDGGEGYPYGNVIDYDYDDVGHDWDATGEHTYIGGWTYTVDASHKLPYVPTAEEGWTVKFNIRVLQHYVVNGETLEEYIWFNVYDDETEPSGSTQKDGFKVGTKSLTAGVWYACTVSVKDNVWTATKTAITGENEGETSNLSIVKETSASSKRYRQFAFCTYPRGTSAEIKAENCAERRQCHFQLDEIVLSTVAYSTEPHTEVIAAQDFNSIEPGDEDAVFGAVKDIVDGGTDYPYGDVANYDYDSDALGHDWSDGADHAYVGTQVYTDVLPYVPSPAEGYTVKFNIRAVNKYKVSNGETETTLEEFLYFCMYDAAGGANKGFRVKTSTLDEGVWYACTVSVKGGVWTATKTVITKDGATGETTSLDIDKNRALSHSRKNQISFTFIPRDTLAETRNDNSAERRACHFQVDEIEITTERLSKITASIDGTSASGTPILAAYDTDGLLLDYVLGTVNGTKAEFDIKAKIDTFKNASSVKTIFLENLESVKPLAEYDEVGNEIWGGVIDTDTECASIKLTEEMLPDTAGASYGIIAYTVNNSFDASNIPSFEAAGNDLLYLGQVNELPDELIYKADVYDYTKEDIVVVINNGAGAIITILEDLTPPKFTNIALQLGGDESELNLTFYTISDTSAYVKYAKLSELVGGKMPEDAAVATAARTDGKKVNYYANKSTITGLEPSTVYAYQLVNGVHESEIYTVTTGGEGSFSFVFAGDPQIGRGYGSDLSNNISCIDDDAASWGLTLSQITTAPEFAGINFLMSAGDQTNSDLGNNTDGWSNQQLQWDAYGNHEELAGLPTVTVLGNHDIRGWALYPFHTNEPNLLTKEDGSYYGASYEAESRGGYLLSADYYFTYNNVLFLVLNVNNFDANDGSEADRLNDEADAAEHAEFIERVMEETAGEEFDWTIALYHESPYGSSYHGDYTYTDNGDGTISYNRTEQWAFVNMRELLIPVLYENGVDLILSGHDHCYTRTHVLKPATDEDGNYINASVITPYEDGNYVYADGTTEPTFVKWKDKMGVEYNNLKVASRPVSVTDPDGIVHITGATSSGSQPNPVSSENMYAAVTSTANTRQVSRLNISENELTIVTYNLGTNTTENITEIDRFTIIHTEDETTDPDNPGSGSEPNPDNPDTDPVVTTEISSVQLLLEDDLTMRYNVTLAEGEDIADYTMRFTINGNVTTVTYSEIYNGKYVFPFSKIAPQMMGDNVKAELIKNGELVTSIDEYSILENVNYLLGNSPDAELEALLLDLLEYGAAAQLYTNYKTDALVNEGRTATNTSTPSSTDDVRSVTDSTDNDVYCVSAGVRFDSVNKLYVKLHADSLIGVSAKFGSAMAEIVADSDGYYYAYSEGIFANDFDKEITFNLYVDGVAVQTLTYSVNTYAYAKYDGNTAMNKLALAMYRYGKSAENYSY